MRPFGTLAPVSADWRQTIQRKVNRKAALKLPVYQFLRQQLDRIRVDGAAAMEELRDEPNLGTYTASNSSDDGRILGVLG